MKQKLFTLLTLLLVGISSAWATTTSSITLGYSFWGKTSQTNVSSETTFNGSHTNSGNTFSFSITFAAGSLKSGLVAVTKKNNAVLTISAPSGFNITQIVTTFSSGKLSDASYTSTSPSNNTVSPFGDVTYTWTGSASSVAQTFNRQAGDCEIKSVVITYVSSGPTLNVSPSTQASGFAYETGAGPSSKQTYTVTGTNLSTTITATLSNTTAYEMRTGDNDYAAGPLSGLTSGTAVDVRLKAGLSAGDYNSNLTFSSTGADNKVVALTGTVSDPKTATVTTINSAGITNLDVKSGTAAGTLTASVTAGGSPVGGATVTWASSDESIVKVGETTGVVTLVAAGDAHITATYAGDETYAASFDDYAIEVIDTRKQVTLSFSTVSLIDYNYDGETLTAPTLTAKDQSDNTIDLVELPELSFAVDKEDVVTVNATTGVITAANTNNFGTSTVTVSFPGNSNYKAAASKSYTVSRAPMLYQVKFDNGFEGFIEEGTKKVNVFYMAGTSAPAQTGTIKKADGYTANVVGNTVVLTKDTHTKTYNIVATAKAPFEGAGKQTFSAVPDYVASVYGYASDKGLKFSKKANLDEASTDWTREAKGNSRLYFFVGAASSMTLTAKGTARAVKVRVNGGVAAEESGTFTIALNGDQPNMIEIQSNQTGGDGGYQDMTLTAPKKAVTVGANGYTTFTSTNKLDLTDANRPEGLKAYKATRDGANLTFTALNQAVPAETGLLLLGETKGGTYYIPIASESTDVEGNALVGVITPTAKQSDPSGNYYFVMKKATTAEDALTFAPLSTSAAVTIPAGKAYIEVPNTAFAGPAHELSISFEEAGDVTAINKVEAAKQNAGVYYNLAGQRVAQPTKGLYIVNGKKVVLK